MNYDNDHLFDNSYIIINYRFRNAIYYRFGNHKTLDKQIKIFNLKTFDKEFDLIVYGFFQKKKYKIQFDPRLSLDNSSFKTTFSNLNLELEEKTFPKLAHNDIYCDIRKPKILLPEIKIVQPKIKVTNTTFNQTEFI